MIEVKTILNVNLVRHFNKQQSTRKMWPVLILTALFVLLGMIGVISGYIGFWYGMIIITVGILLPVVYLLVCRFLLDRTMKNTTAFENETVQVWRFLGNKIMFNETGKHRAAHDESFTYDMITKVEETPAAFYLYINKKNVYILDAHGFNIGTRTDFHNLLTDKIGRRYKCNKKIYAKK